jgi:hypothetical protein
VICIFYLCIKSESEEVLAQNDETLSETTKSSVEEKDVTPVWKKVAAAAINAASGSENPEIYKIEVNKLSRCLWCFVIFFRRLRQLS